MASLVTQSVGAASSAFVQPTQIATPVKISPLAATPALQAEVSRSEAQKTAVQASETHKDKAIQRKSIRAESPFGSSERPREEGPDGEPSTATRTATGKVSVRA